MLLQVLLRPPAPHQRPINIIGQPTRQGNVEINPQLLDVLFEEGVVEVLRQSESQQPRGADGQIGVARKINVQVQGGRVQAQDHLPPGHFGQGGSQVGEGPG